MTGLRAAGPGEGTVSAPMNTNPHTVTVNQHRVRYHLADINHTIIERQGADL